MTARPPHTADTDDADSSDSTSTSLLERVKARDPQAWFRLTDLYGPLVYSWCRRAGLQPDDAADVGQEVFVAVAASIQQLRCEMPENSFRGWLRTITRNKICDHFRRGHDLPQALGGSDAQRRLADAPAAAPADASSVQESHDDRRGLVHRALAPLEGCFRGSTWKAFWRTTVGGEHAGDVAADLGMSVQAVYQAKHRVLMRLRKELAELFQ